MPRLRRPYLPDCPQHIIQRGNNREACFVDAQEYKAYLHHLENSAKLYEVAIHAFVLMTNHVHLLATPADKYQELVCPGVKGHVDTNDCFRW